MPICKCFPLKNISSEKANKLGHLVENHQMFPNRINTQLLKVLDRGTIEIEIWEKGAGYTLASGSSSCAAAAAAHRLGLVDKKINVKMPGGDLLIEITEEGLYMTGPVEKVFDGRFGPDLKERITKAKYSSDAGAGILSNK